MQRRLSKAAVLAATWMVALANPVWAHGDHDARPLARDLQAGPYVISLWQVYPDMGDAMAPHLIVMIAGGAQAADVTVAVNSMPAEVRPSTTSNGWETIKGVNEGDVVEVTISDGKQAWDLDPVVVPPPPTSMLPMQELLYASIFLTIGTAWWVFGRTARAWRRPVATVA